MTAEQLSIVALTITTALALYQAGRKKVWVWGYQLEDEREEKEFWRGLYLRLAGITEDLIEKHEPRGEPPATSARKPPARRRG